MHLPAVSTDFQWFMFSNLALQHVNEHSYKHFAVFISTHGGEVREGDHYIHKLSFYDGDESTEEILFKPLDEQLRKVKKLVIIQVIFDDNM